jgi:hypothetical protein
MQDHQAQGKSYGYLRKSQAQAETGLIERHVKRSKTPAPHQNGRTYLIPTVQ